MFLVLFVESFKHDIALESNKASRPHDTNFYTCNQAYLTQMLSIKYNYSGVALKVPGSINELLK